MSFYHLKLFEMFVLRTRRNSITTVLVLLLIFTSKSDADESLQVSDEATGQSSDEQPATAKAQQVKSAEAEHPPSNSEDKDENSKLEKSEPLISSDTKVASPDSDDKTPNSKIVNSEPQETADSKPQNEKVEGSDQPTKAEEEKVEDIKSDEVDHPSVVAESKKSSSKDEENNHKTNLNDVNAYTADEGQVKAMKRETRYAEFLGLPRDASYFFDDLEPFINNNSDNRVGRAAPSRDTKNQKSKLNGKGKETIEDDIDEDDEDTNEDENEKEGEDDYEDDDDMDSDCQPDQPTTPADECKDPTNTKECSTKPPCTSTNKKSTTQFQCPTTCRTSTEKTKCPKICAKANRKAFGYPLSTDKTVNWDSDKRKLNNKKRKFHSKVTSGK